MSGAGTRKQSTSTEHTSRVRQELLGEAVYLVRETKGTRDFLKVRSIEADKVRCGVKHFATLGVDFKLAVTADEL